MKQAPPFCAQIELSEGCNLQCSFCGIQGIREKAGGPFKFMTVETAERIASSMAQYKWNSRVEFAMHGEPSLNPDKVEIVKVFRSHLPRNQLMMTSNGAGFLKDTVETVRAMFAAGLNILALDDYQNVKIVPKVLDRCVNQDRSRPYIIYHYPEDGLKFSPHRRWPRGTQVLIVVQDILEASKGSHAVITNHAGCGSAPNDKGAGKRCAKPFREIGFRWDGSVAGCCNDWRGIFKVDTITDSVSVEDIWQHPRFVAMRKKLLRGERDFGACIGCDYVSYRNGLLPDQLGKKTMSAPNAKDLEHLRAAVRGKTLTAAVIRPWEIKRK